MTAQLKPTKAYLPPIMLPPEIRKVLEEKAKADNRNLTDFCRLVLTKAALESK